MSTSSLRLQSPSSTEGQVAAESKVAPKPKILFVVGFAPHYRVRTFELLAERYAANFLFYSDGDVPDWLPEHGVSAGRFHHEYLPGFSVAGVRITPKLISTTWTGDADVIIKGLSGKFALPVVLSSCLARRRPYIIWASDWSVIDSPVRRLYASINNAVCRSADAVVTYGEHVTRYLVQHGVRRERIFTSRHAVTNSLYSQPVSFEALADLRRRHGIPSQAKIILFVGRLVAQKGLSYLLRGFAQVDRVHDACLLIVGTGPERAACESLARELGIENRVRFAGYVAPQDSVTYYAASHAFVLPSVTWHGWKEAWGLVVNEAFNQGLPVVATEAVGAAAGGLVVDGENGFVVPEGDQDAITGALQRILGDNGLRERLSANARTRVALWDQKYMVDAFANAIEYVAQKRGRARGHRG